MRKFQILPTISFFIFLLAFSCKPDESANWKHKDNTVRVRLPADITTLNPYLYRTTYEAAAFPLAYQYLMGFGPETLEMAPQLVKSAPVIQDITEGELAGGQTFSYEILDEAVWDDGKPVTGYDYLFSLKAVFNPKMPTQRFLPYLESVVDVQVDAANPKKFTVFNKNKYFLAEPAASNWVVLPEHIFDPEGLMKGFELKDLANPEKAAAIANDPKLQQFADAFQLPKFNREVLAGSGPYTLVEWVDGQRIVLAKKKNWWGDKLASKLTLLAAYPDTIVFVPIPDQAAASSELKNENIDVMLDVESKQYKEFETNALVTDVYNLYAPPRSAFFYIGLNNKNPKLADKRVRRALAMSIDRDAIVKQVTKGNELPAYTFTPPDTLGYTAKDGFHYDPEQARQLLADAGYPGGKGFPVTELLYNTSEGHRKIAVAIQQMWYEQLGIKIILNNQDWKVYLNSVENGDYAIAAFRFRFAPPPAGNGAGGDNALTINPDHSVGAGQRLGHSL